MNRETLYAWLEFAGWLLVMLIIWLIAIFLF